MIDQNISKNNKEAYQDIILEMLKKKDGVFSFELRISNGNIMDFVIREYISYGKIE